MSRFQQSLTTVVFCCGSSLIAGFIGGAVFAMTQFESLPHTTGTGGDLLPGLTMKQVVLDVAKPWALCELAVTIGCAILYVCDPLGRKAAALEPDTPKKKNVWLPLACWCLSGSGPAYFAICYVLSIGKQSGQ